jgi:hypothetical protein
MPSLVQTAHVHLWSAVGVAALRASDAFHIHGHGEVLFGEQRRRQQAKRLRRVQNIWRLLHLPTHAVTSSTQGRLAADARESRTLKYTPALPPMRKVCTGIIGYSFSGTISSQSITDGPVTCQHASLQQR